jgi:hypothetical protein
LYAVSAGTQTSEYHNTSFFGRFPFFGYLNERQALPISIPAPFLASQTHMFSRHPNNTVQTMTSFKAAKMLVGLCCLTTSVTQANLCDSPSFNDPDWPFFFDCMVEEDPPASCGRLFSEFVSSDSDTQQMMERHRTNCCGDSGKRKCLTKPLLIEEKDEEDKGDEGFCGICGNTEYNPDAFPGTPGAAISARYVTARSTCEELYWMGVNRDIDDYMCGPLQDYAFDVCGCKELQPKGDDKTDKAKEKEQDAPNEDKKTEEQEKEQNAPNEDKKTEEKEKEQNAPNEDKKADGAEVKASCASFKTEDKCEDLCKWEKKKKKCKDQKRRLRGEQSGVMLVDYILS